MKNPNKYLFIFIFAIIHLLSSINPAISKESKGILFYPIKSDGKYFGTPGDIVYYSSSISGKLKVKIQGRMIANIREGEIIPFHAEFTPSAVYSEIYEDDFLILYDNELTHLDEDYEKELRRRLSLSQSMLKNFPNHRLTEDFDYFACELNGMIEGFTDSPIKRFAIEKIISCYKSHLKKFPKAKYKDISEWTIVQWENYYYEVEGFAEEPLQSVKAYEKFLKQHPDNKYSEEIKYYIAREYRVAYECVRFNKKDNKKYSTTDQKIFNSRSLELLTELANSGKGKYKELSIALLYNINHGRSIYWENTSWGDY